MYELHHGDCLEVLKSLPECSVDAVVTDPPYGLSFMGKRWDYDVPSVEVWTECLRVLKPGGYLLAFAGTRTQHRMAVRIEDAGFEIRDMIAWVYGSGFPKSLDVSKALDKAAGAERESIGPNQWADRGGLVQANTYGAPSRPDATAPATEASRQWQGWGTALKPALEPITVARKPLIGTVAANVLAHGTGAVNVDGCRVGSEVRFNAAAANKAGGNSYNMSAVGMPQDANGREAIGRWPANLIHDGSEEVAEVFGDPARFFYCAKASKKDRDEGLDGFEKRLAASACARVSQLQGEESTCISNTKNPRANVHPTVKPTDLMRYLCRLVTPPRGVVLDPFTGSGSTGKAAMLEGFRFIGIEREAEYVEIAKARVEAGLQRLAEELAG